MYLGHWKLVRRPFDERVNPRWFFAAAAHSRALAHLGHAVEQRSALVLVAGGLGSGKSMVTAALSETIARCNRPLIQLDSPPNSAVAVLAAISQQLEASSGDHVEPAPPASRACGSCASANEIAGSIRVVVEQHTRRRRHPVVIVDDAQNLSDSELCDLVTAALGVCVQGSAAMTLILVGVTELLVRARRIAALDQRLFQCLLGPMASEDTAGYIRHRLRLAGGDLELFSAKAVDEIDALAAGVPRRINRLCDLSLLAGYADGAVRVEPDHVWSAQRELRLLSPTRTATDARRARWQPLRATMPLT